MKRKLLPLFCALMLCVPGLCASEMTEVSYPCDAEGCGYEGPFSIAVTRTETRDGAPGEWIAVQCPQCGTVLLTSWRQTGPAAPPQETPAPTAVPTSPPQETPAPTAVPTSPPQETPVPTAVPTSPPQETPAPTAVPTSPPQETPVPTAIQTSPPQEDPLPASPEPPVTAPPVTDSPVTAPPATQPPEVRPPETAPPLVTMPPVPADPPPSAAEGETAESGRTPEPDPVNSGTEDSSGFRNRQQRRNLQKYPYFSAFYPSRRLNLEGDPGALAPIPGIRIYPPEGSSILQHMLDGE